jgi:type I restriction enzyme R subunit
VLNPLGLRYCQTTAIQNLEQSFKDDRPRCLVQMATGSGKTFTAITSVYRLLKYADAKRVLFLVDTKNLGEQAEQEFMSYLNESTEQDTGPSKTLPAHRHDRRGAVGDYGG